MKRVLSLVLALVLVLGMIPTFAADMTAGQHLFEHEFIAGDGMGNLNEDANLTREQLAKLILELNGSKEEAEALTLPPSFTDSAKISAWARPYVAYAQIEGLMVGFTDGSFRPQEGVTGQQLAAVLTRALGYEFSWATVLADAADLGIEVPAVAKLTRGEAFEAMWVTVNTNPKDGDKPLGVVLGKIEDPNPPVPPVGPLAADSIVAKNLNQIEVKFNKAVDKTIAETEANYTIGGVGNPTDAVLLADEMTVVLNINTKTQGSTAGVTVKDVWSKDLKEKAPVKDAVVTFSDVVAPAIESVTAVANKIVVVKFTEPVANVSAADFTLDGKVLGVYGGASGVASTAQAPGQGTSPVNQKFTLTFNSAIAAGAHTLEYTGATPRYDAAGFLLPATSKSFTIEAVTSAPVATITATKAATTNGTVTVSFDRVMDVNTLIAANFMLDVAGTPAASASVSSDMKSVTLTYNGGVAVGAHVLLVSPSVKDAYGNAITSGTANVRIVFDASKDVTPMTVVSTTSNSETVVTIQFSEAVDSITGNNNANYVVFDAAGAKVAPISSRTLTPVVTNDAYGVPTKVVITLGSKLSGGTYTVQMSNLKDTAGNVMPQTSPSFSVTDLTAPTFADKDSVTAGIQAGVFNNTTHQVEVFFAEPMQTAGAYSVLDKGNWLFNGATLPTYVTVAAGTNSASVIFTFATTDTLAITDDFQLIVGKDLAGNVAQNLTTAAQGSIAVNNVNLPYVVKATVKAYAGSTANDYVTFDVSDFLANFAAADFTVNGQAPTSGTLVGKTVTLYFADGFLATGSEGYTLAKPGVVSANSFGGVLTLTNPSGAAGTVYDMIAPHISAVKKVGNTLEVTFDEDLDMSFVGTFASDFVVDNSGATITPTYSIQKTASSDTIVLGFASSVTIASSNVKVYPAATVAKVVDNTMGNLWVPSYTETLGTLATDGDAPTVVTGLSAAAASITITDASAITFSEALNAASKTNVQNAITAALTAGVGGADTVAFVWSLGDTVVTLDVTDGAVDGVFLTIAADVVANITDAAGNTTAGAVLVNNTTN